MTQRLYKLELSQNTASTLGPVFGGNACTFIAQQTLSEFLEVDNILLGLTYEYAEGGMKVITEKYNHCLKQGISKHYSFCQGNPLKAGYKKISASRHLYPDLIPIADDQSGGARTIQKNHLQELFLYSGQPKNEFYIEPEHENTLYTRGSRSHANGQIKLTYDPTNLKFSSSLIRLSSSEYENTCYGIILGAVSQKHVFNIIRTGNNYFYFNSKPPGFFSSGSRIGMFFTPPADSATASNELISFLKNEVFKELSADALIQAHFYLLRKVTS
jgi:hypothetical protein